jgi:zinc ribbon protein
MQCSSCGYSLPAGAAFCTNCGAKMYGQGNPGSPPSGSSPVEPTIPVSSPYEATPITPSSNQQAIPPTVYGAPYSMPQQYSYEAPPPPPPANVYGATPPSNPYGASYVPPPGSFVPPGQPPTPRQGPRVGLIIGIVVLLLLVIVGGVLALNAVKGSSQTNTNKPTAGNAEMYWCTQSDCSNAKLATFVTFNVA